MLARMSSHSRTRTGIVLGVSTAIVAGALGGALWMAFSFTPASDPSPAQVNVRQAAATAQPTATVTVTKAAARKPAAKKTTAKARTLVNAPQGAQAAADPAPQTADPEPANGSGQDPDPNRPTGAPTLPGRGGPTTP